MIGRMLLNWLKGHKNRKAKPVFSSSFIQSWYCQDWDFERWVQECQMLQKIGIREIIVQTIADTKAHYTVYPTKIEGYTSHPNDMLATALRAAGGIGMNVRIGLGFNNDWWSAETLDREWLDHEAEDNQAIVSEIMTLYGRHQAFAGWYIPHEFHPLMALTNYQQANLNRFFRTIARSIKAGSSKSIMIAPFYNARFSGSVTLTYWANIVRDIVRDTGIDILALQDSIGAGFNKLEDLDEIFAFTKKAADKTGLLLFAIIETFEETKDKNLPAAPSRIREQIFRTAPYVRQFVAFSISHYQNPNESAQINGYNEYYRYFQSIK